jgi:hypothetical protein
MEQIRIVAIPTKVAESVRSTGRAPVYGHPAHTEVGTDSAPCRHCLRLITPGIDRRILFTYDRFAGVESLPLPGPIFVHADACEHYRENAGFPDELRTSPRTLEGYARGRHLVAREYVTDGKMEPAQAMTASRSVDAHLGVSFAPMIGQAAMNILQFLDNPVLRVC